MPRKIIPLITNEYYHVYNRGVDKRDIFLDKFDYIRFYQSLEAFNSVEVTTNFKLAKLQVPTNKLVEVIAYSLLSNHFHLILKQNIDGGISEFMKRVTGGYTSYFNESYSRSGSLLQGTFKRVLVEGEDQMRYLFAYVNENHYVHGIDIQRELYHSSSLHYQRIAQSKLILKTDERYSYKENKILALEIYKKRKLAKTVTFDTE